MPKTSIEWFFFLIMIGALLAVLAEASGLGIYGLARAAMRVLSGGSL